MALCVACSQPLVLVIDEAGEENEVTRAASSNAGDTPGAQTTVPDDVGLPCGCHFHWYLATYLMLSTFSNDDLNRQCLLDAYTVAVCPSCGRELGSLSPSNTEQLLCTLHNEGGLQENIDILPLLKEECYLKCYPEERKAHAFIEFCRQGDLTSVIDMLLDDDSESSDGGEDGNHIAGGQDVEQSERNGRLDVLRYQDPLGDMQSALHAAVLGGSCEIAWLLLLLASDLEPQQFPPEVLREAETLGLARISEVGKTDIRSLRDEQGRSAEDLAAEARGVWVGWIGTGRLAV